MKTRLIILLTVMNVAAFAQQAHWEGSVQMPNRELRMTVDLAKNSKGAWIGSISLPDGGLIDVPLGGISVAANEVSFVIAGLPKSPSFEGKVSEDGKILAGTATSDKGGAPFELKKTGEADVKVPPPSTSLSKEWEGSWEGILDAPDGRKLRAVIKLARASDGTATGSLVSLDEGSQEFPMNTITQKDKQLQFEIRVIRAKYTGLLNDSGAEISGDYVVQGLKLPLVLKRKP